MHKLTDIKSVKTSLLSGCAITVVLAVPAQVLAEEAVVLPICDDGVSVVTDECIYRDATTVVSMPVEPNQEEVKGEPAPDLSGAGFSISIDGDLVAGDPQVEDKKRVVDLMLEAANLQVKFDGLDVQPRLNVSTADLGTAYTPGSSTTFTTTTNYPAWVQRSQLIIRSQGAFGITRDVAAYDVTLNADNAITLPNAPEGQYAYVLRVYDAQGNYDETAPLPIAIVQNPRAVDDQTGPAIRAGEGEDRAAIRNINVYGGSVTVHGDGVVGGSTVVAMGEVIPVDQNGKFVVQRILPPGDHSVGVSVNGPRQQNVALARDVEIPENDIFYFGVADATIGRYLEDVPEGEEQIYKTGRLAGYVKGRIKGEYLLTAALDTGEGDWGDLLNGLDEKDPRSFFNRIDPNDYYPVYGDDSTFVEDAPTSGKLYVRVEHKASHVLWGNFKVDIDGNRYVSSQRALYGAEGVYRTEETTALGEARASFSAYAAQAERLQRRDVLRGTGGSAYFLKHQDITPGSETVTVQIKDPDTGRVTGSRELVYGTDYTVDYFQGVILLTQPLSSSAGSDSIVTEGPVGGDALELVVNYENTPADMDVDDVSYGARGEGWLTDHLRIGASHMHEDLGAGETRVQSGVDILYQTSENTFVAIDMARSEGRGFDQNQSFDGGLAFSNVYGRSYGAATAQSVRAQADLAEMTDGRYEGVVGAFYETKEAGFFTEAEQILSDQTHYGVYADVALNAQLSFRAEAESFEDDTGKLDTSAGIEGTYRVNDAWSLGLGLTHVQKRADAASETGTRLDFGARLTRHLADDQEAYVFAQGSANASGGLEENQRYGIGGTYRLNDRVLASGEISDGTRGLAAEAMLTYQHSANSSFYAGYRLDPDRSWNATDLIGTDNGQFVVGGTSKVTDQVTYYGETSYDLFGERKSLTNAYGVNYTPNTAWSYGASFELGKLTNADGSETERTAVSGQATWADADDNFARIKLEYRTDRSTSGEGDRDTYLVSGAASYKTNPNWRVIASADLLFSDSDESDILDGEYAEASLGYAYRPVENDRLNMLAKYTYLYDLPGADQVTVDGTTQGDAQRSHIISVDANYDLNAAWTIGGKIGYRSRETAPRDTLDWTSNTAWLAVARVDYHVTHNWDAMGEIRALRAVEADSTSTSGLVGVYRHFGNNVKAGVGYDWGKFSDDLRSTTQEDSSVFLNVIAKF